MYCKFLILNKIIDMRFYEFLQQQARKEIICKDEKYIFDFLTEQLQLHCSSKPCKREVVKIMLNTLEIIKSDVNLVSVLEHCIEGFVNPNPTINLDMLIWQIYFSIIYN